MKLIVFSDSHHANITDMLAIIDEEKPDCVLHLGDLVADVDDIRNVYPDLRVHNVRGNNDWNVDDAPEHLVVCVEQVRIFMTHGHRHGVRRGTRVLEATARRSGCTVALYGHTHESELTWRQGMLIANPGSISMPYNYDPPSYLRLEIHGETIEPELVFLKRTKPKKSMNWF